MYTKGRLSKSMRLTLVCALVPLGAFTISPPVQAAGNDLSSWQVANPHSTADDNRCGACTITKINDWGTGFKGEAVIVNDTPNRIDIWSITFEADFNIDNIWNAKIVSHTGNTYVVQATGNNKSIAPGGEVKFGFNSSTGNPQMPSEITLLEATLPPSSTQVTMENIIEWGSGFQGLANIVNTGSTAINGWTLSFDASFEIQQIWNARVVSHIGTKYVVASAGWNDGIAPDGQASFGFIATPGGSPIPVEFTVIGNNEGPGANPPEPTSEPQTSWVWQSAWMKP